MKNKPWIIGITIGLAGLLIYLLFWRWQVSQLRFFDIDEFTHLHLAAQVARGERPYIDFFTYFSPAFMWVLTPLFWISGVSFQIFSAARIAEFGIFFVLLCLLFLLFGYTRSWRWALLPAVILAFLPMPYDKFLEVRPDTIATLFACAALLTEVVAIRKKNEMHVWLVSGVLYGISLVFLIKMAPFLLAGWLVAAVVSFQRLGSPDKKTSWVNLIAISGGICSVLIGFFGWAALHGALQATWYSVVRMPFEIFPQIQGGYYMAPYLFFYPNSAFYGPGGSALTAGLLVNHALWILASAIGVYRLCTPYLRAQGNKEKMQVELLIALAFLLTSIGYLRFSPVRFSQYLIPVAVFIAYYAADGISLFFDWLTRTGGYASLVIVLLGWAYVLIIVTQSINAPKILNSNTGQRSEFNRLVKTVPLSARVVDLDGMMLFWSDGYPMCCLPLDDFIPYVSRGPLPLARYLSSRPADYVYNGYSGRLDGLLPENVAYVKSHFTPVPGFGGRLLKRL